MEIRNIEDIEQAHKFVSTHALPSGAFLQSQFWGEFQKKCGSPYWYFGAFEGDELKGVALVLKLSLPLGKSYLYCPKGPVVEDETKILKELLNKIKELATKERAIFLRFEPTFTNDYLKSIHDQLGVIITKEVQPKSTWVLDISKPGEELLAGMKQKTRYNIRLAEKKKTVVRTSDESKDVEFFFNLAQETAKRNGINTHPKEYYTKMIDLLSEHSAIKLYLAEYEGKTIAANLMLYFGDNVTYLHGGSNSDFRNLMAPYLLHWQAIQDAKKENYQTYDFGGVSPENDDVHKWSGISRFKRGFGGKQINSVGTFDLAYHQFWYKIYKIVRKFR
ncbi:peptidoglycan bridge formation glycyltransferase FemA/FemB family protein [Patescibacteria group bacterium]|nr:peptidoglycan bridge formation glycyltransferase FemA/FemB family protein [Patescibacteria group bacterium]